MKFKKTLSCLLALTIIFSALGNFYVSAEEPVKLPGTPTGETITYALGVYYLQWDDDPWWDEWEDEFVVHKYNDFEYIVTNYPDYTWERCEIYIINYTGEESNLVFPSSFKTDNNDRIYVAGVDLQGENPYVQTVSFNFDSEVRFIDNMKKFTNLEKVYFKTNTSSKLIIDHYAFSDLISLKNVYIKSTSMKIREIGVGAFYNCKNLKTFDFSTNIENIRESAFEGCESLNSSVIAPENIESRAFYGCKNITRFSAENIYGVEIGQKAFKKCKSLKNVNFDCVIKKIKASAFENCTALKTVKLNKGYLESINENAFKNCKNLTTIKIGNESKTPNIHKKAFTNAKKGIKFYVMKEKVAKKLKSNLKKSNAKSPKIYVKKYYAYY